MTKSTVATPSTRPLSLPRLLLGAGLILILLAVTVKGIRLLRLYYAFETRLEEAAAWQAQGLAGLDPKAVVSLTSSMRADALALREELDPFLPLAPYLIWLPRVGPLMPVAPELVELLDAGTLAADSLATGLSPALPLLQGGEKPLTARLPAVLEVIGQAAPELATAQAAMTRVEMAYSEVSASPEALEALPWRIRRHLPLLGPLVPHAPGAVDLIAALPQILGADRPVTYLLVAQNEDELRPTGGFISGVGLLTVDRGRPGAITFIDAYEVDDYLNKPYPAPPQALEEIMGATLFLFRDANFWPDFPTSAAQMVELYTYGQDRDIDGLIAIDQHFLGQLVTLLQQVQVPELTLTLTADNVADSLRGAWESGDPEAESWFWSRKSFLGPVANALKEAVESRLLDVEPASLAAFGVDALEGKHMQVYLVDPQLQSIVIRSGLSGRLALPPGMDFMQIVDTNVGFNKANAAITRQTDIAVELQADGGARTTVMVDYAHAGRPAAGPCRHEIPSYAVGTTYNSLVDVCYWNYVRLFLPAGHRLIEASHHPLPEGTLISGRGWDGEPRVLPDEPAASGLQTLANLITVPSGGETRISWTIQSEDVVQVDEGGRASYTIRLGKQPGAPPEEIRLSVQLPPGSRLLSTRPTTEAGADLEAFKIDLRRDETFEVIFTLSD